MQYDIPDDHPMFARWLQWITEAERIAGHSLDGGEADDYSLSEAFDFFWARATPAQYVAKIQGGPQLEVSVPQYESYEEFFRHMDELARGKPIEQRLNIADSMIRAFGKDSK